MTSTNASHRSNVNFAQLNVSLCLAYKAGGPGDTPDVQAWVLNQLNSKPEFAEVTASNATGFLSWADFLDAPMYGPEHPDYEDDVALLNKVEHWLTLDRGALIDALLAAEGEKRRLAYNLNNGVQLAQAQVKDITDVLDLIQTGGASTSSDYYPEVQRLQYRVRCHLEGKPPVAVSEGAPGVVGQAETQS